MNALILASLLAAAPAGTALEQGLKREITLLVSEQDGLRRELERIQALRAARVAALQRELATLEAKAIDVAGREATARAALAGVAPSSSSSSPPPEALARMREGLGLLGVVGTPATSTGEPLVDQLAPALARLDHLTSPQRLETGFFGPDGTWLQGAVVRVGDVGVAATTAADGVAGPLLPGDDGTLQIPAEMPAGANDIARQIVQGQATTLWPIALGAADAPGAASGATSAGVVERLAALGVAGVVVLVVLLTAVGAALAQLLTAIRRHRAVVAVAGRLVGLVAAGETVAAAALARTVGGAAGRFLVAVVAVVGRATPEDEVAALSAEATAALQRAGLVVRGLFSVAAAIVVVVSAGAVDGILAGAAAEGLAGGFATGLATGLLPLMLLALAAVPFIAAVVVGDIVVARTRELLEVTALRLLDAASRGA